MDRLPAGEGSRFNIVRGLRRLAEKLRRPSKQSPVNQSAFTPSDLEAASGHEEKTFNIAKHEDILSLVTSEPISEQFPLADYHYWRDGIQQLQQGTRSRVDLDTFEYLVLPGETQASSSSIAHAANITGRQVVFDLREGRKDKDGKPYVLCIDEVSDAQVLRGATQQEKEQFFRETFSKNRFYSIYRYQPDEAVVGVVGMGAVLLGMNSKDVVQIARQGIIQSNMDDETKTNLQHSLQHLSEERVRNLLSYIKASKNRLIQEDKKYTFKYGPRKYGSFEEAYEASVETGESLFNLRGSEYAAPGPARPPFLLSDEESEMILPLREAIHQGRQSMIDQARVFAAQYLTGDPDKTTKWNPPDWWTKGEKTDGLRSDEVLIFVPYRLTPDEKLSLPSFLGNFEGGWYQIKVPYMADGNVKMGMISKLSG